MRSLRDSRDLTTSLAVLLNSLQTTLTSNPEQLFNYCSVAKQTETCVSSLSSNAFKFRPRWFGDCPFTAKRSEPALPPYLVMIFSMVGLRVRRIEGNSTDRSVRSYQNGESHSMGRFRRDILLLLFLLLVRTFLDCHATRNGGRPKSLDK